MPPKNNAPSQATAPTRKKASETRASPVVPPPPLGAEVHEQLRTAFSFEDEIDRSRQIFALLARHGNLNGLTPADVLLLLANDVRLVPLPRPAAGAPRAGDDSDATGNGDSDDEASGQGVNLADLLATGDEAVARPISSDDARPSPDEDIDVEESVSTIHVNRAVLQGIEADTYHKLYTFYVPSASGTHQYCVNIEDPYLTVFKKGTDENVGFMRDMFPAACDELEAAIAVRNERESPDGRSRVLPKNRNRPGPRGHKYGLVIPEQRHWNAVVKQKQTQMFTIHFQDLATGDSRTEIYRHIKGFDWSSKKHIKNLNKWYKQQMIRRMGQERYDEAREMWTVEEQAWLNVYVQSIMNWARTKGNRICSTALIGKWVVRNVQWQGYLLPFEKENGPEKDDSGDEDGDDQGDKDTRDNNDSPENGSSGADYQQDDDDEEPVRPAKRARGSTKAAPAAKKTPARKSAPSRVQAPQANISAQLAAFQASEAAQFKRTTRSSATPKKAASNARFADEIDDNHHADMELESDENQDKAMDANSSGLSQLNDDDFASDFNVPSSEGKANSNTASSDSPLRRSPRTSSKTQQAQSMKITLKTTPAALKRITAPKVSVDLSATHKEVEYEYDSDGFTIDHRTQDEIYADMEKEEAALAARKTQQGDNSAFKDDERVLESPDYEPWTGSTSDDEGSAEKSLMDVDDDDELGQEYLHVEAPQSRSGSEAPTPQKKDKGKGKAITTSPAPTRRSTRRTTQIPKAVTELNKGLERNKRITEQQQKSYLRNQKLQAKKATGPPKIDLSKAERLWEQKKAAGQIHLADESTAPAIASGPSHGNRAEIAAAGPSNPPATSESPNAATVIDPAPSTPSTTTGPAKRAATDSSPSSGSTPKRARRSSPANPSASG